VGAAMDWEACQSHGEPCDWIETLASRLAVLVIPGDPRATLEAAGTLAENASQATLVVR
jgi:hypothetical protein